MKVCLPGRVSDVHKMWRGGVERVRECDWGEIVQGAHTTTPLPKTTSRSTSRGNHHMQD